MSDVCNIVDEYIACSSSLWTWAREKDERLQQIVQMVDKESQTASKQIQAGQQGQCQLTLSLSI